MSPTLLAAAFSITPGPSDICFLTIFAGFSLVSADAAVLSQSYLLAAASLPDPSVSHPSALCLVDLTPGQTNNCLLKASRSETRYVICPLLIQGKPLIGTGQIFAGCPPCPWRHLNWLCFSWIISFNSYTIKKKYYQAFFFKHGKTNRPRIVEFLVQSLT